MIAVYKHEVRSAYNNLTVYLFSAALLCFVGLGAMYYNIQASVANFEYVLSFVSIGLVVIIPVLTMRSFAEERKQKTDQLLYSLPLKTWQIVVGKYLSLVTMFFVPTAIICLYPYVFSLYGDVYLPGAYGALAAFFALGAALIALGVLALLLGFVVKGLTKNVPIALGVGGRPGAAGCGGLQPGPGTGADPAHGALLRPGGCLPDCLRNSPEHL